MLLLALLSALLAGVAILVAFGGMGRLIQGGDAVRDRLDVMAPAPAIDDSDRGMTAEKRGPGRLQGLFNRSLSERGFGVKMATDLARANMSLTVYEYMLLRIGCAAVLSLLPLLLTRQILFALPGIGLGWLLPSIYVHFRQNKRLVAFQDQLPDVLTLLVGSLRSGYGMTIAMDTVAKNMPPPASEEFTRVVREIGLGVPAPHALNNLVRRIRSDDLDLMVTAISVQHEVGGNLAGILETISDTIRERIRLKGQLRALISQPMMTRYVLTALPLGLGGILFLMNREYMLGLFTPGPTLALPIGAAVLLVMGYLVMGKLAKIEV